MLRVLLLLLLALPAMAHPLPTLRYDRTVIVRLTASGVAVEYVVELGPWSMARDPENAFTPDEIREINRALPSQKMASQIYARKKNHLIADRLMATVNGSALSFEPAAAAAIRPNLDHDDFRFQYFAAWPAGLNVAAPIEFHFTDGNFESVDGQMRLSLAADDGLLLVSLREPAHLRDRSPLDLKPGEDRELRMASATFRLSNVEAAAIPKANIDTVLTGEKLNLMDGLRHRGLSALFDSDAGLGLLLLAAGLFGAAHAFTPGHGKTLVAAYLIGERGTYRHALVLGITTTLAHTGSVIGVATVLWSVYGSDVPLTAQGWLQFAGGMLILLVGVWLLRQRLLQRADHVHLFHEAAPSAGWGRVMLLGLGGGLVPCWDAVLLLLVAISVGRLGLAIPLLIAFSVGLAVVLVALGMSVVGGARRGASRFGEQRWFRALPIVSAVLLSLMGLWMAREGVQQLTALAKG